MQTAHTSQPPLVTLDNAVPIADLARKINKSPMTLLRWCRDGLHGHYLANVRLGRGYFSSEAAVMEFGRIATEQSQAAREASYPKPRQQGRRLPSERRQRYDAVNQALAAEGI